MSKRKDKNKGKGTTKVDEIPTTPENSGEESTEIVETSTETEEKEEVEEKPISNLPSVPLKVFCQLSGKKPDQIAGFRRFALNQKLKAMTVPQWREQLVAFENRPMR